jgi:hypothetical protein
MSYVPAQSRGDLLALLAAGAATVLGVEWIWRRLHPAEPDDTRADVLGGAAGDPFPGGTSGEPRA